MPTKASRADATAAKWQAVERDARDRAHSHEIADLKNQIRQFAESNTELRQQLDTALAVREAALCPPRPIKAQGKDDANEAVAVAVAGDWHVEETVDPKTVNGLNAFTLDIADARIARFFESVVRLTEIERHGTKIDTLVMPMLGDMMTGYIHEELQEENGLSPTQTILWLRQRIRDGMTYLRDNGGFSRIVVPCSYGNHGRTTKKPRHATGAQNSYEWLLWHVLADDCRFAEWQIADGYHNYLEVFGRVLRIHHGDNIAYQGGVGGITISVEKAIANWNKARVAHIDIFGHHHTQQQNPRWIANGSLIGYGAYSLAIKAAFEPPQQTFFLIDSKRGRTGTWPIHLD